MNIEFDPAKDEANIAKHGVSLSRAVDFEMQAVEEDDREIYGETRFRAFGLLAGKPYSLAFTMRAGAMRVVSLRRTHAKEYRRHVQEA